MIRSLFVKYALPERKHVAFWQHKKNHCKNPKEPGTRSTKFPRQREVAQDDVSSPHNWKIFNDTLLCALADLESAGWYSFLSPEGEIARLPLASSQNSTSTFVISDHWQTNDRILGGLNLPLSPNTAIWTIYQLPLSNISSEYLSMARPALPA